VVHLFMTNRFIDGHAGNKGYCLTNECECAVAIDVYSAWRCLYNVHRKLELLNIVTELIGI